jgi:hypothetical protein
MVPKDFINNSLVLRFIMARKNTPATYACGSCGVHGHNKRTCPALGLAPKTKPVKKPRAKKVEVATVEVVPTIPVATEEQIADLRALVAQIEAAEAVVEVEETEVPAEVEACDVDDAFDGEDEETEDFDAEPTDAELAEIEAEDEAAALALLAEIEALAG